MIKGLGAALRAGQHVYGTMIVSTSPRWLTVVPQLGLDYVFIDTEHIALERQTASWMCQAYAAQGIAPVLRISSPDPNLACMALDGGAVGIVAPYVETPEQVISLRGAVKLRPLKGQRLQAILSGREKPTPELNEYLARRNADNVLIVNIESTPALKNLDAILAVPDLDAVLIGPHDLSTSLGVPEQYDHPTFEAAVDEVIVKARDQKVGVGFHTVYAHGIEQEIRWINRGLNMILHLGDIIAFRTRIKEDLDFIKREVGDLATEASSEMNADETAS